MVVLCTGGESCGTRLAGRLVEQMGGEAVHRSVPHGWQGGHRVWPVLSQIQFDAAIVMVRDWSCAIESQLRARHVRSRHEALANLQAAYGVIPGMLEGSSWRYVSYEALVQRPQVTIRQVADWLGLDASGVTETVTDENAKWLR